MDDAARPDASGEPPDQIDTQGRRPLVTIAALYGAGGSSIGPLVAEVLEVPFHDRNMPEEVARRTGLPAHVVDDVDDVPRTLSERFFSHLGHSSIVSGAESGSPEMVDMQSRRVRSGIEQTLARIAMEGGVVIGRGGNVVLGRFPWALHVLLRAPLERRLARRMGLDGIDRETAERRQRHEDDARVKFVRRVYGIDGSDPAGYHLVIDTSEIDDDTCADLIVRASRYRVARDTGTE
ncbi:MAG: AAA family ATPase [Intrasporangium sp.]|uniref:cytidylate kinase-like family protein n=1 Tax=Intrasporangium sp. TaxID=1925024 RepID=UPI003F7E27C6